MEIFQVLWWGFWILGALLILSDYWFITAPIVLILGYAFVRGKTEEAKQKREHERRPCLHGVPGGKTMQNCASCLAEEKSQLAEKARRDELKAFSFQMRQEEINRLSKRQPPQALLAFKDLNGEISFFLNNKGHVRMKTSK